MASISDDLEFQMRVTALDQAVKAFGVARHAVGVVDLAREFHAFLSCRDDVTFTTEELANDR